MHGHACLMRLCGCVDTWTSIGTVDWALGQDERMRCRGPYVRGPWTLCSCWPASSGEHALTTACISSRKVMGDLAPGVEAREADLNFLYDACRAERGAPMPAGVQMLLLRPALVEWAKLARAAVAVGTPPHLGGTEGHGDSTTGGGTASRKSAVCAIL